MSNVEPVFIQSRDNPLLVRLRKLVRESAGYRQTAQVWLEGEHLCGALRGRGWPAEQALISASAWDQPTLRALAQWAPRVAVVPDALFDGLSALPSSAGLGLLIATPRPQALRPLARSVVLDRVQDAGNVGSILRTASAFGFAQVLALQGTAALWSPKVLRAGMGAHFGLHLVEGLQPEDLLGLQVPWIGTALDASGQLEAARLPDPCAWLLGHEGQGVAPGLLSQCAQVLRIAQPGGEESLNVAAAAAVCLFESMRQRGAAEG